MRPCAASEWRDASSGTSSEVSECYSSQNYSIILSVFLQGGDGVAIQETWLDRP